MLSQSSALSTGLLAYRASLRCSLQAFEEDCGKMFDRIREAHETEGSAYDNGAEAMAETLEIIRKNEVRYRCFAGA